MEPKIIFQDSKLMVLGKPPGWVVNDAVTTVHQNTIQGWLNKNFDYEIKASQELRSGIVHRLDKDTSGVLLIAKTEGLFYSLQSQFKERKVKKTYLALSHGHIVPLEGEVNVPTGRYPWNKRKFGVVPGGRETLTRWRVLKHIDTVWDKYIKYSLVELYPKTGRTHQIRVHLKHIGHPIVSDYLYAGRKAWRHDTKWCPRIFLHAASIEIEYPKGKTSHFGADLPADLASALGSLE